MTDDEYLKHCLTLLDEFARRLQEQVGGLPQSDPLRQLADSFTALSQHRDQLYSAGTEHVGRLFSTYPELAPLFPRELLYFLGGDCLHFMPDEEIAQYQQLEEMRIAAAAHGETLDLREARAKLLNLQ